MEDTAKIIEKISSKIVNSKYVNRWLIFAFDVIVATIITLSTYLIIGYIRGRVPSINTAIVISALSFLASVIVFYSTGVYKGILRHTTSSEIWRISIAAIAKTILEAIFIISFFKLFFPSILNLNVLRVLTIEVLCGFLVMAILTFTRIFMVYIYNYSLTRQERDRKNVLVYEIENRSLTVRQYLESYKKGKYNVCGFIKLSSKIEKHNLAGKPIFYVPDEKYLTKVVKKLGIQAIVFPNDKQVAKLKDSIVKVALNLGLKIFVFPSVSELSEASFEKTKMREIKIEDLLGREEISIDMNVVKNFLQGKRVMVTGAAGSIGSELSRQISQFGVEHLVMLDNAETPMHNLTLDFEKIVNKFKEDLLQSSGEMDGQSEIMVSEFAKKFSFYICDVRNEDRLEAAFKKFKPQIIFHAAAYKHVPMMELNPTEAVKVNVKGTKNVANFSLKYGVEKMIMISTDKAVNPTNVMGASKRIAEIYTQSLSRAIISGKIQGKTKFVTTRFGNVLGSNGSVIPHFKEQIANGGPLTVTHKDIVRYFMSIPEACSLVLEAATLGNGYEIFAFDMGKPVKIVDLARNMIKLAGYEPDKDIKIEFTGLRPGEKLYEELLHTKENTILTSNDKIFVAKVKEYEFEEVDKMINELLIYANQIDIIDTVRQMKRIVPEFKSKNSVYEELDKAENFNAL